MRITTNYGEFESPEDYEARIEEAINDAWQRLADAQAAEDTEEREEVER